MANLSRACLAGEILRLVEQSVALVAPLRRTRSGRAGKEVLGDLMSALSDGPESQLLETFPASRPFVLPNEWSKNCRQGLLHTQTFAVSRPSGKSGQASCWPSIALGGFSAPLLNGLTPECQGVCASGPRLYWTTGAGALMN